MDICSNCDIELTEGGAPVQGCAHLLCWDCLAAAVLNCVTPLVACPLEDCSGGFDHHQIASLVSDDIYHEFLNQISEIHEATDTSGTQSGPSSMTTLSSQSQGPVLNDKKSNDANSNTDDLDSESGSSSGWEQLEILMKQLVESGLSHDQAHQLLDMKSILVTIKTIKCSICLDEEIKPGDGVIIKNCLHMFCRSCLQGYIEANTDSEVQCPYRDNEYTCEDSLKPRELLELTSLDTYKKHYDEFALKAVENSQNIFHCLTPNCGYFCELEGGAFRFKCPRCREDSCFRCKVIHSGVACAEYQRRLEEEAQRLLDMEKRAQAAESQRLADEKNRMIQRRNLQLNEHAVQSGLQNRVFKPCPRCRVVIEKNAGCDHMHCSRCNYQYNWSAS